MNEHEHEHEWTWTRTRMNMDTNTNEHGHEHEWTWTRTLMNMDTNTNEHGHEHEWTWTRTRMNMDTNEHGHEHEWTWTRTRMNMDTNEGTWARTRMNMDTNTNEHEPCCTRMNSLIESSFCLLSFAIDLLVLEHCGCLYTINRISIGLTIYCLGNAVVVVEVLRQCSYQRWWLSEWVTPGDTAIPGMTSLKDGDLRTLKCIGPIVYLIV